MKRIFSGVFRLCKWVIIGVILVEVASFLAVSLSNYWIYGQLRDGDVVSYDPYALFLEKVRPTLNNPAAPGPGALTFWMFGGSTMRGATDFDGRTIPSCLARDWNRDEPAHPATLDNFGQDGFNSLMETKYLQKLLIENRPLPNLIVFYDGGNDSAYFAQDRTPYGHQGYERVRGMIEDYHRSLFGLLKPLNAAMWSSFTHEIYDKMRQGVFAIAPGPRSWRNLRTVAPSGTITSTRWPPPSGPNSCWSTSPVGGRKPSRWPPASGPTKTWSWKKSWPCAIILWCAIRPLWPGCRASPILSIFATSCATGTSLFISRMASTSWTRAGKSWPPAWRRS